MQRLERRVRPFEIKSSAPEGTNPDGVICSFKGLGAVYLNLDATGDIIDPAAFDADLPFLVDDGVVRDEHCVTTGRIVAAKSSPPTGLVIGGEILDTSAGRDQAALVKGGAVKALSIGYATLGREWLESTDAVKAYWKSRAYAPTDDDLVALGTFGGARLITRARVYEVSTTWMPANDRARITEAKDKEKGPPPAGRTLADHSSTVLATVAEYLDRVEKLRDLRAEKNRPLGPEVKARLDQLRGRIEALRTAADVPPALDANTLYAEFLAGEARRNGVG